MCFSATASFTAAGVLSVIGAVTIRKASKPSQKLFASIPLIFAIQQLSEGFLWLSLSNESYSGLTKLTTHSFLFFAQIIWPLCIPIAVLKLESNSIKRNYLVGLSVIATLTTTVLLIFLIVFPVSASISGHHIEYNQGYPEQVLKYGAIPYLAVTIVPLFISGIQKMKLLGAAVLVSYIFTAIFYRDYILSVWCFFSSIISIIVFMIIRDLATIKAKLN